MAQTGRPRRISDRFSLDQQLNLLIQELLGKFIAVNRRSLLEQAHPS